jgi:hypothetical protein
MARNIIYYFFLSPGIFGKKTQRPEMKKETERKTFRGANLREKK